MNLAPWFDRAVVERLLPHRPPLLLVDAVRDAHLGATATLRARFAVDPAHPALAGHFPGRPVWPGVYTVEGLAQAGAVLLGLEGAAAAHPGGLAGVLAALREGGAPPIPPVGLLVEVDVRFLAPVGPGEVLDYAVRVVDRHGPLVRLDVAAGVGGREVARGTLRVSAPTSPPR